MSMVQRRGSFYKNGYWVWDDEITDGVKFVKKDVGPQRIQPATSRMSAADAARSKKSMLETEIRLADAVDSYGQAKFRRYYQRKVTGTDPAVVTIQDIKDVAIFTCKPGQLSLEFVSYFHTEAMDRFLRALLVYFQYYLQVWNKMQLRRTEASRKLRQPVVTVLEDVVSDNLGDLRAMAARNYAAMLLGMGDAKKFHHMNNKNNDSLSDKDRRLFETMCFMLIKFTWIGLFRKQFSLIAKEINRLLRTDLFNAAEHASLAIKGTPEEDRVLLGSAFASEKRLLHRSPAAQEIVLKDHDYRMLAIGICEINTKDKRINYLEAVYSAPEELFLELGVGFGILGVERRFLDPMLRPLEMSTTEKRTSVMEIYDFDLPPRSDLPDNWKEVSMGKPCKYKETVTTKEARKKQLSVWKEYITTGGFSITSVLQQK